MARNDVSCYLCLSEVEVHLVVGGTDGLQVKVPESVDLQLESQGRLKVTVDLVLFELQVH